MNKNQTDKKNYFLLLKEKDFCKLLFADVISRFGDSLDIVAYSWIMYEITGSEALLAVVMGLNYLPTIFLMPFAGALIDNINKKKVMIIADLLRFSIVSLIVFFYMNGSLNSSLIIVFTLLTSTVEAFRIPAANAIIPSILSKDSFSLGQGAKFSLTQISMLIGFSVAGISIAKIGSSATLIIDAITFLLSAITIFFIKNKEIIKEKAADLSIVIVNFKKGATFFFKNKSIQTLAIIGVLINASTMSLNIFQTPYVQNFLNSGADTLSYIKTISALSIGVGAAICPKIQKISYSKLILISGVLFGFSFIIAGFSPYIENEIFKMILVAVSMFGIGFACGTISVILGTCKMKVVPTEMLGCITGIYGAIMQSALPISSFVCSILVLHLPLTCIWAILGSITTFAFIILFVTKKLLRLDIVS